MREAVGGSILFYIILVFLALYIVFIGIIINYAATYRASNYVLTQLEQTDGTVKYGSKNEQACDSANRNNNNCSLYSALKALNYHNNLEVCYIQNAKGIVFKIRTSVDFQIPFFKINWSLPINNETKTIYNVIEEDVQRAGYSLCSDD